MRMACGVAVHDNVGHNYPHALAAWPQRLLIDEHTHATQVFGVALLTSWEKWTKVAHTSVGGLSPPVVLCCRRTTCKAGMAVSEKGAGSQTWKWAMAGTAAVFTGAACYYGYRYYASTSGKVSWGRMRPAERSLGGDDEPVGLATDSAASSLGASVASFYA
eukprot:364443-Chlamydomonas_euryale.AAC.7